MSFSQVYRSLRAPRALSNLGNTTKLTRNSRIPSLQLQLQTRRISSTARLQQTTQPGQNTAQTPPSTSTSTSATERATKIATDPTSKTTDNISKTGLSDKPLEVDPSRTTTTEEKVDWTRSFHGLSAAPFPKEVANILLSETDPEEVEIKPDGIVYLPEIKYRRILNRAFGPGAWGLVPRSESIVTPKTVTREYALVCNGRLVSVARGEQDYFTPDGIPTATEGCRSNALVRCCKDLGIASELWDPRWIRKFRGQHTKEVFVEHVVNKRKTKIWLRKDDQVGYPWKASGVASK